MKLVYLVFAIMPQSDFPVPMQSCDTAGEAEETADRLQRERAARGDGWRFCRSPKPVPLSMAQDMLSCQQEKADLLLC